MKFDDIDARIWAGFAGLAGAVVSMQFIKDLTPMQKVMMAFSGFAMSTFVTPMIQDYLQLPATWSNGTAFLVGMFGWSATGSVILLIRNADLWPLVQAFANKFINK